MTYLEVWKEMWEAFKDFWKPREEMPQEVPEHLDPKEKLVATLSNPQINHKMSYAFSHTSNQGPYWNLRPSPEFKNKLWVYNVSRVSHIVNHPMLGDVTIPANTTRKRYSMWTSFPEVVMGVAYNMDTNERSTYPILGKYFVDDLINPDCHDTLKYDGGTYSTAIGRDLSVKGVFWSYSNPPKPTEVNLAVKKLKNYYADLLERTDILYASSVIKEKTVRSIMQEGKCSLDDALIKARVISVQWQLTPEIHAAAEYFKVTTPWHPVLRGQNEKRA